MGLAAAAGHARLCAGLRLHRLFAVRRAAAKRAALGFWVARALAARSAQPGRRGAGVHGGALPVCVSAGAHRLVGARRAFDGSGALAGRAVVTPHSRGRLALGAPGRGRWRGAGVDGNTGRFWRVQLLWHPDLHCRYLQGLAVDGQPHGRRAIGDGVAGLCRGAVAHRAQRSKAHALCRWSGCARRRCRCRAGAAARRAGGAGLGGLRRADRVRLCAAGAVHAAAAGAGLEQPAVGPIHQLDAQQPVAGRAERRAGHRAGAGAGVCRAPPAGHAHARCGATGQPGLCRTGRGDCGRPAASRGLAAGGCTADWHRLLGHCHGAGRGLGLSGAL